MTNNMTDEESWLLGAANGMLDLRTGEFREQPETSAQGLPTLPGSPHPSPCSSLSRTAPASNPASREKNGQHPGDLGRVEGPPADPVLTDRQVAFLEALSGCGSVVEAARQVGLAPRTPRRWARDDDAFAEVMQKAHEVGLLVRLDALEQEADRRAKEGVDMPVYQGGKLIGTRRQYSDLLLIFRMKRLDPAYRDNQPKQGDTRPIQILVKMADGSQVAIGGLRVPESLPEGDAGHE